MTNAHSSFHTARLMALTVVVGTLAIGSGIALPAAAADRTEVEGLWASGGSLLQVTQVGESLSMRVVALEEPVDDAGVPFVDVENPDPTLRSEPLLGMEILSNYEFKRGRWQGKIYDPETGKTYSSRMKVDAGKLEMRGYIGTPLLGKTKRFRPASECRDDIVVMLRLASITGYCGFPIASEPGSAED